MLEKGLLIFLASAACIAFAAGWFGVAPAVSSIAGPLKGELGLYPFVLAAVFSAAFAILARRHLS